MWEWGGCLTRSWEGAGGELGYGCGEKGAEKEHTEASVCMCGGVSSSTNSPALGH